MFPGDNSQIATTFKVKMHSSEETLGHAPRSEILKEKGSGQFSDMLSFLKGTYRKWKEGQITKEEFKWIANNSREKEA